MPWPYCHYDGLVGMRKTGMWSLRETPVGAGEGGWGGQREGRPCFLPSAARRAVRGQRSLFCSLPLLVVSGDWMLGKREEGGWSPHRVALRPQPPSWLASQARGGSCNCGSCWQASFPSSDARFSAPSVMSPLLAAWGAEGRANCCRRTRAAGASPCRAVRRARFPTLLDVPAFFPRAVGAAAAWCVSSCVEGVAAPPLPLPPAIHPLDLFPPPVQPLGVLLYHSCTRFFSLKSTAGSQEIYI